MLVSIRTSGGTASVQSPPATRPAHPCSNNQALCPSPVVNPASHHRLHIRAVPVLRMVVSHRQTGAHDLGFASLPISWLTDRCKTATPARVHNPIGKQRTVVFLFMIHVGSTRCVCTREKFFRCAVGIKGPQVPAEASSTLRKSATLEG